MLNFKSKCNTTLNKMQNNVGTIIRLLMSLVISTDISIKSTLIYKCPYVTFSNFRSAWSNLMSSVIAYAEDQSERPCRLDRHCLAYCGEVG